jgi:hypothetical protein
MQYETAAGDEKISCRDMRVDRQKWIPYNKELSGKGGFSHTLTHSHIHTPDCSLFFLSSFIVVLLLFCCCCRRRRHRPILLFVVSFRNDANGDCMLLSRFPMRIGVALSPSFPLPPYPSMHPKHYFACIPIPTHGTQSAPICLQSKSNTVSASIHPILFFFRTESGRASAVAQLTLASCYCDG